MNADLTRAQVHGLLVAALLLLAAALYLTMGAVGDEPAEAVLTPDHGRRLVHQLIDIDELDRAEQVAERLIEQHGNTPATRHLFAELRLAQGRPADAAAALEPVAATCDDPAVLTTLGRALRRADRLERAESTLNNVLALDPGHTPARAALIELHLARRELAPAADLLDGHFDAPPLRPLAARWALAADDADRLATFLEPRDAAIVAGVLAMRSEQDELLSRLTPPGGSTPWAQLVAAWRAEPNPPAAQTLVELALDALDDPLQRPHPLPRAVDPAQRLLRLAESRWPGEPVWNELDPPAMARQPGEPTDDALTALVADPHLPARRWDAAVAELVERRGPRAAITLIEQTRSHTALGQAWLGRLYAELNEPAEAHRWVAAAAGQRPDAPRVLAVMARLAPSRAQLDNVWPGGIR